MSDNAFGLIELILVFSVALALAIWQLWTVRRRKGDADRDGPPDSG